MLIKIFRKIFGNKNTWHQENYDACEPNHIGYVLFCASEITKEESKITDDDFERYYQKRFLAFQDGYLNDSNNYLSAESLEKQFLQEHVIEEKAVYDALINKDFKHSANDKAKARIGYKYLCYLKQAHPEIDFELKEPINGTPELNKLFDIERLKSIFNPYFYDKRDYNMRGFATGRMVESRFETFCTRLQSLLQSNTPINNKALGELAYMIYNSQFTRPMYKKPRLEGKRGHFSRLLKELFNIVGKKLPCDMKPSKYYPENPESEMVLLFGDILKWSA